MHNSLLPIKHKPYISSVSRSSPFETMDELRYSDDGAGSGRSYSKEEQDCMEDLANKLFAFGLLHPNRHHATLSTLSGSAITTPPKLLRHPPTPVNPPVIPPAFLGCYGVVPRVFAWQRIPPLVMGSSGTNGHRHRFDFYEKKSKGTGVFLPRTTTAAGVGNRRRRMRNGGCRERF